MTKFTRGTVSLTIVRFTAALLGGLQVTAFVLEIVQHKYLDAMWSFALTFQFLYVWWGARTVQEMYDLLEEK